MLLTAHGAVGLGLVLPPLVRRGEPVCPGREAGCRASGAGPWTAHRRVPLDKRVSRRYPTSVGRISGGGLSFGDFSLATQRKATRPGPKGGRNPIEGGALAFHAAKPHQGLNRWLGNPARVRCRGKEICCGAMRCAYYTLRCSIAWRSHATTSTPRTSDYASLIRPTEEPTADAG